MSEVSQLIMWTNIYRIALLVVGVIFAILGARLFEKSITAPLAEGQATWGKFKMALKRIGPGATYVVGAAAMVIASIVSRPHLTIDRPIRTREATPVFGGGAGGFNPDLVTDAEHLDLASILPALISNRDNEQQPTPLAIPALEQSARKPIAADRPLSPNP
jgi:hypothetical protein